MKKKARAIRNLLEPPRAGDVFQLGEDDYFTVLSVRSDGVRYVSGIVDASTFKDPSEEQARTIVLMPYKTFRKWLATIAAGRRVDTPPPS
jgi:hypothetical protein